MNLAVADYKKASTIDPIKYTPLSEYRKTKGKDYKNAFSVKSVPEVYETLKYFTLGNMFYHKEWKLEVE